MEKVHITEMEKLILLADDVLTQVAWQLQYYNADGRSLDELCRQNDGSVDEKRWFKEWERNRQVDELSMLLKQYLREKVSVNEVRYERAESILERLEPLKTRIIGIFRNGAEQNSVTNETEFCADESIPDETLLELFAMRVRDRRLLFALQREHVQRKNEYVP